MKGSGQQVFLPDCHHHALPATCCTLLSWRQVVLSQHLHCWSCLNDCRCPAGVQPCSVRTAGQQGAQDGLALEAAGALLGCRCPHHERGCCAPLMVLPQWQQALCRCGGLDSRQWPVTAEKMQAVRESDQRLGRVGCWTHGIYQGDIPARPVVQVACAAGRRCDQMKGLACIESTLP